MMSNKDLAQQFSIGAEKGTGSHMFIEGDTIYSYGYHFPIARRCDGYVLFNSRSYSHSTAKHMSHVRSTLDDDPIYLAKCDLALIDEQIKSNESEHEELREKIERARSDSVKSAYFYRMEFLEKQNRLLEDLKE